MARDFNFGSLPNGRVSMNKFKNFIKFIHVYNEVKSSLGDNPSQKDIERAMAAKGYEPQVVLGMTNLMNVYWGGIPTKEEEAKFMQDYYVYMQKELSVQRAKKEQADRQKAEKKYKLGDKEYSLEQLNKEGKRATRKVRNSKLIKLALILGGVALGGVAALWLPSVIAGFGVMSVQTLSAITAVGSVALPVAGGFLGNGLHKRIHNGEAFKNNKALADFYDSMKQDLNEKTSEETSLENLEKEFGATFDENTGLYDSTEFSNLYGEYADNGAFSFDKLTDSEKEEITPVNPELDDSEHSFMLSNDEDEKRKDNQQTSNNEDDLRVERSFFLEDEFDDTNEKEEVKEEEKEEPQIVYVEPGPLPTGEREEQKDEVEDETPIVPYELSEEDFTEIKEENQSQLIEAEPIQLLPEGKEEIVEKEENEIEETTIVEPETEVFDEQSAVETVTPEDNADELSEDEARKARRKANMARHASLFVEATEEELEDVPHFGMLDNHAVNSSISSEDREVVSAVSKRTASYITKVLNKGTCSAVGRYILINLREDTTKQMNSANSMEEVYGIEENAKIYASRIEDAYRKYMEVKVSNNATKNTATYMREILPEDKKNGYTKGVFADKTELPKVFDEASAFDAEKTYYTALARSYVKQFETSEKKYWENESADKGFIKDYIKDLGIVVNNSVKSAADENWKFDFKKLDSVMEAQMKELKRRIGSQEIGQLEHIESEM